MKALHAIASLGFTAILVSGCGHFSGASSGRCGAPFSFPIYFSEGADTLTPIALTTLENAVDRGGGCIIERVTVTGLADAVGDPQANLELSRRRAAAVTNALEAKGVRTPLTLEALGESQAVTPSGAAVPMQRRSDVTFYYQP